MAGEDFSKKYTHTNFISRRIIDNFYKKIAGLIRNLPLQDALEVACGPGFSTQYLTRTRPDLNWRASDEDEQLVIEARQKNPNLVITAESIYHLDRLDDSLDLVIALEVLEHLAEPERALRELKRVTKKYCLVSVPREPLWRILNIFRGSYLNHLGNTPGHINHWSSAGFKKLVSPYFKIVATAQPLPWTILLLEK